MTSSPNGSSIPRASDIAMIGEWDPAVDAILKKLATDVGRLCLRNDLNIHLDIAGRTACRFVHGQFVLGPALENDPTRLDAKIAFQDEASLIALAAHIRNINGTKAATTGGEHVWQVVAVLCRAAMPGWSATRPLEVTGAKVLASLLWDAWTQYEARSSEPQPQEQSTCVDDFSQGWVIVRSVHPKLRDRVATFDKEIRETLAEPHSNNETDHSVFLKAHWVEEFLDSLRISAEQPSDGAQLDAEPASEGSSCSFPERILQGSADLAIDSHATSGLTACRRAKTKAKKAPGAESESRHCSQPASAEAVQLGNVGFALRCFERALCIRPATASRPEKFRDPERFCVGGA